MRPTNRIIAVHLLNDISGSPLVFSMILADFVKEGKNVELYTSKGSGFLSNLQGIKYNSIPYSWSKYKMITLFNFLFVQLYLLVTLSIKLRRTDLVYVNTLLPFGALLAAKLRNVNTIQHMHEVSVKPPVLFNFLCFISEHCTNKMVFVSHYLKSCFTFKKPEQIVTHNRLNEDFIKQVVRGDSFKLSSEFTVLMLCSLKEYKGVYVFARLANDLPEIKFKLVLNASLEDIENFKLKVIPGSNFEILNPTKDTHQFYRDADLLLNLSLPDQWIETFGMTILEAKAYGLKVIAPPIGGPAEIVNEPVDGWLIDARNYEQLHDKLSTLSDEFRSIQFENQGHTMSFNSKSTR